MTRTILLALATCAALSAVEGPVITCKPVMFTACAELPAAIDFQNRPMGYELGFKIAYLVEGEDLIGFKKGSLTITSITTADGKDISKKRNGKPSYKEGSFPKTTDDGKFAIFDIVVAENVFGKLDGISVNGSITALSGSDRQTKKVTFTVGEAKVEVEEFGGLKINLVGGDQRSEKKTSFGVQVVGDVNKVAEITLFDGTTKVDSRGSSWSDTSKTYNFAKPAGNILTVEISYWNKLDTVVVPIGAQK